MPVALFYLIIRSYSEFLRYLSHWVSLLLKLWCLETRHGLPKFLQWCFCGFRPRTAKTEGEYSEKRFEWPQRREPNSYLWQRTHELFFKASQDAKLIPPLFASLFIHLYEKASRLAGRPRKKRWRWARCVRVWAVRIPVIMKLFHLDSPSCRSCICYIRGRRT